MLLDSVEDVLAVLMTATKGSIALAGMLVLSVRSGNPVEGVLPPVVELC